MLRTIDGKTPDVAASAFISEAAYVIGDVKVGENSGVWPGAVVRADFGAIKIGRNCQIEDNSVLHSATDMEIGDNVIIGHGAVVHCRKIGNNVLIGNSTTVLDDVVIGDDCIIGAHSLVSAGHDIPRDSFVAGIPARIMKEPASAVFERMNAKLIKAGFKVDKYGIPAGSYLSLVKKYKSEGLE